MRIVVLDDYPDALRSTVGNSRLAGHDVTIFTDTVKGTEGMVARLAGAEAVLLIQQRSALTREMILRLPQLRMIAQTGTNTGHIDVDACTERGIVISVRGTGSSAATAELTWGLVIAAMRELPRQVQRLRDGYWLDSMGTVLAGKTLGILGFGKIGALVAGIGRAFGMRVVVWGRDASLQRARQSGFEPAESRAAFFAMADVLSIHLALNEATRRFVTAGDLALMKESALLVNTGRAALIQRGALEAALRNGRPGRAAVDVFEDEPVLGAIDPLIGMPNVLCTPHLGYSVRETYQDLFTNAIDQLLAFAADTPVDVINPQALTARRLESDSELRRNERCGV